MMSKSSFQKLYEVDVNHKTKGKNGLKYLSWPFAWAEFKKVNPTTTYTVDRYDGKPYLYDENLGYLVSTVVTVDGLSMPMQLPVMDNKNQAMKATAYQYKTRNGMKDVEAATMFDINTAIMRCLVKNLAMHGLGLYIYAGEDIPSIDNSAEIEQAIGMIDQAIEANDVKYIGEHWSTSIAEHWNQLGNDRIAKLNKMAGL
tara:strand:+ start:365 stop:964 length:600 start_codon:yes stop_codon:yes gene_type:complete